MGRAVLEAEAVVSGFQYVAVVGEPVEQRGGHLCVAEDACPFTEAEVGGDDDAGALIKLLSRWKSSAPPEALNGRYPNSSRMTRLASGTFRNVVEVGDDFSSSFITRPATRWQC